MRCPVVQPAPQVMAGFDGDLFQALAPPFPKLRVLHFGGSTPGDVVDLELDFGLYAQRWTSVITERGEHYFVDEGRQLPWPLRRWRHVHQVQPAGQGSVIIDAIEYSTGSTLGNWLMYPALWLLFAYRKPIYRRIFG